MRRRPAALLAAVALALAAPTADAQTFDFETVSPFAMTPFTDTQGGVTASFVAPPGFYQILTNPGAFVGLTGQYLGDPHGPVLTSPLEIAFSTLLGSISLNFAIPDLGVVPSLTLEAFLGATSVGTTTVAGAIPAGFFSYEGTIGFSGALFDSVVLSSDADDFNIDAVAVSPAVVPEPGTVALVAGGLALLVGVRTRRRTG